MARFGVPAVAASVRFTGPSRTVAPSESYDSCGDASETDVAGRWTFPPPPWGCPSPGPPSWLICLAPMPSCDDKVRSSWSWLLFEANYQSPWPKISSADSLGIRPRSRVSCPDGAPFTPPPTWPRSVHSRGTMTRLASATELPGSFACSDLVVLHHLAGFLRSEVCRLVASCCRSLGSLRFS